MTESVELEVPVDVAERLESRLRGTEFSNASEYASFILEEVLQELGEDVPASQDETDRTEVENRLKSLGYLDE